MISVDEALQHLASAARTKDVETLPLAEARGRILGETVAAMHSQPEQAVSAMDGYAVRFADLASHETLDVVGDSPAGHPFAGDCPQGGAVRVFTGSVVPPSADHVVIQEDVCREGDVIRITQPQGAPRNLRAAGIDFSEGQVMARAGETLDGFHITAIASAGHGSATVYMRPRVGIIANGDELRLPGEARGTGDVICSTPFGLIPLIESWGGAAHFVGIASDNPASIIEKIRQCDGDDVLLPIGGASVGDHDHMRDAFAAEGWETIFQKIAVKPGKPTWFSAKADRRTLGLPGNPASALVCAILFLKPLIFAMTGRDVGQALQWRGAPVDEGLAENGGRESFLRARRHVDEAGRIRLTPMPNQDSSLITPFLKADVLIRRPRHAPAIAGGSDETVPYIEII